MCIILVGKVTKAQHEQALSENRDGFSLFTKEQGLVKCPTPAQVKQALGKFGIWHYRIGTSGNIASQNKLNVHPFPICHGEYLLYHNGVLGDGLGNLSDTHALANTLYDVSIETARTVVQSLTTANRFLLVKADDPTAFELYGAWSADAGVLMSHKMYPRSYYYADDCSKTPTVSKFYGGRYGNR